MNLIIKIVELFLVLFVLYNGFQAIKNRSITIGRGFPQRNPASGNIKMVGTNFSGTPAAIIGITMIIVALGLAIWFLSLSH